MNWHNLYRKLILSSPFHARLSHEFCLLTIHEKHSPRQRTLPLRYLQKDNTLLLLTQESWWHYLKDGAIVRLHLQGHEMRGVAFPILSDKQATLAGIHYFLCQHPAEARKMGIEPDEDGVVKTADVVRIMKSARLIHIILTQGYEPVLRPV
jgi:hypothetical protein